VSNPRAALLALALAAFASAPQPRTADPASVSKPPVARKEPHVTRINGDELRDDYFWLRQKGTRSSCGRTRRRDSDQYLESSPLISAAISEADCAAAID
jgi:hypothetical protein